MLTGEFKHNLDTKGRVFVPAKFRADLGQSVILAKSFSKYLVLYSENEWNNFMEKIDALAETEDLEDMKRFLMRGAVPVDVDAQGRISIDAEHREFAHLEKEISFIGMRKYVEVWSSVDVAQETSGYDLEKLKEQSKRIHLGL